jgi:F420-dependent methylenetetrahydromethanopterin dehydrogenase
VISDGLKKKEAIEVLEEEGFRYIILPTDLLIRAKRYSLDSV